jgi:hypothetical protein
VIAAGNREGDGAFVQGLSHPLANRFVHITLIPDVDDFIEWGMHSNIRPEILGYAKAYPDCLSNYDPDSLTNGNYGFSTPRTLSFLSDQYEDREFFKSIANGANVDMDARHMQLAMFSGIIGEKESLRFFNYLDVMNSLPSPEDVMNGTATKIEKVERSKTFGLLFALVQNLKYRFDKYYDPEQSTQPDEWITAKDNILDFITDNYERESGTWAATVIFQQMGITSKSLRSDAAMRFAAKNVDVMTRVGRVTK